MSLLRLARRPALSLTQDATVMDAVRLMSENQAGAVVITEGKRLLGIFTERDVMKKIVLPGLDARTTKLGSVMTREVTCITDDTPASGALTLMSEKRIRHLPVLVQSGEVGGLLSIRFLMHDRLEDMLNELRSLEAYTDADGPGG